MNEIIITLRSKYSLQQQWYNNKMMMWWFSINCFATVFVYLYIFYRHVCMLPLLLLMILFSSLHEMLASHNHLNKCVCVCIFIHIIRMYDYSYQNKQIFERKIKLRIHTSNILCSYACVPEKLTNKSFRDVLFRWSSSSFYHYTIYLSVVHVSLFNL